MDSTEQLLKTLTEAHAVSGHEEQMRKVMREYLSPLGEIANDKLGSVICFAGGSGPKVMIAAHMDEVGFIVNHITKEGFLKFLPLGGWYDQVLLGHRVVVKTRKGDVIGVIGAKPPHLLPPEARDKVVKLAEMYIDIGVSSEEAVKEAGVRVGDPVVPDSSFAVMAGGKTYVSKAFDDRIGCAVMIDALRELKNGSHPNAVYGVATVMEEVASLRGAKTSVHVVNPDVAIILESGIAGDTPGITPEESAEKLGGGPVLGLYDALMIPNLKLRDLVYSTAEELKIPLQHFLIKGGATDGGAIHIHQAGVPTVVLSVSARHIHSHNSIIHREDYDRTVKLVAALVRKLDVSTVNDLVSY
jgi:putative aminopeptidase FrvX